MMQELEQMGLAWLILIREQFKLFTLEAKLAKMSFVPALICTFALLLICLSTWICALALAGYCLYYLTANLWVPLISLFILNVGLLVTVVLLLKRYLQRMSFQYTRAQFHENKQLEQTDQAIS